MRYSGFKGIICSDDWDLDDATVMCRTLGQLPASAVFHRNTQRTMGAPLLNNVNCTGDEKDIHDCSNSGWGPNDRWKACALGAGVVCGPPKGKRYEDSSLPIPLHSL